ncbi:MAG: hypothetical protein ACC653_11520 [Gammaproteobacteria bacterium]
MMSISYNKKLQKLFLLLQRIFLVVTFMVLPLSIGAAENNPDDKKLLMSAEVGFGYDDNIYRAPSGPYTDNAKHPPVPMIPVIHSSPFIPVRFLADYSSKSDATNTLVSSYKFKGSFYTNRDYSNADQQLHKINFGNIKNYSQDKKRDDELYAGVFLGYKKRLYVDRDTGDNQQSGPNDISDRYTYKFFGGELNYKKEQELMKYKLGASIESRDYIQPGTSSYDYDNTKIGVAGDVSWKVAKPTKLYAGLELYTLNYDTRPSRDADGTLFKSNPPRKYNYGIISVGMRHRFSRTWLIYLDLVNKQRADQFVGYDNYTKILYKARIHYRPTKKLRFKMTVSGWNRDYANALAFDEPGQAKKSYDGTLVKFSGNYQFSKTMAMNLSYLQKNQDSTDLRYAYDRSITMANMEWLF